MPRNLVPQDQGTPEDSRGRRKPIRPEDLRSGTLYGQYQLRGSILTIKDASATASGFMSFSDSMTNAPTSSTSGTGVYIDYTGIYGLNSGTQQFYLRASDGKAYAGGGAVVLDANGITLTDVGSGQNKLTLVDDINGELGYIWGSANDIELVFTWASADFNIGSNGATARFGQSSILLQKNTIISAVGTAVPSSLFHLKSTAPTFRMEDTTASAKSLLVTVDANVATFEEVGGTDVLVMDLANARVGIANAAPAVALDVTGEIRASSVLRASGVTAGKIQMNVVSNLANNGVAQVSVGAADIEIIMLLQSDGSSAIFALKGGANATALVGTGGTYSVTAGTAGTNVYWSAGNSRYEIENKTGGARTYEVFSFNAA